MDLQIQSSMDEYHKDTDIALSWLESTATSNGWRIPTDRELVTRDLIIQATNLADDAIRLPFYAKRAFQRAIRIRQRCQQWFEIGDRSTSKQIEAHRHFIEVLCECYACFDDKDLHEEEPEDQMEEVPRDLSHNFAALELENLPSDDELSESSKHDDQDRDWAHVAVTRHYYKRDPSVEAAFAVYSFFHDIHTLRDDTRELWARVARGEMSLLAASLTAIRYLLFVRELESKVYKTFSGAYRSTGKPYQDMIGVLYNMMNPQTGHITVHNSTPEQSEADRFVFLYIGEVLTKMVQIKPLTEIWSWPPPVPEAKLYKIPDIEFIDSDSFRELADIDRFITQIRMQ
ncbi:hypothetical protein PG985_012624 [Apiospora marii]|uniref:uncharacterized protein n=1 Tax=Apiospora marii TaxID=335849 RepID=UPI00312F262D